MPCDNAYFIIFLLPFLYQCNCFCFLKAVGAVESSPKKSSVNDADSDDSENCLYQDSLPKLKNIPLEPTKESSILLDAKSHLSRYETIMNGNSHNYKTEKIMQYE